LAGVDQDVVDGAILQQGFQGSEPEYFIHHVPRQCIPFDSAERDFLLAEELMNYAEQLLARPAIGHQHQFVEVELVDQVSMYQGLEVLGLAGQHARSAPVLRLLPRDNSQIRQLSGHLAALRIARPWS